MIVEKVLELDKRNGDTMWDDAIAKEIMNMRVAFDMLLEGVSAPAGYQFVRCNLFFDVKLEIFWRKASVVAGGHMTDAPATITYASVVSRDTDCIALTLAALNAL